MRIQLSAPGMGLRVTAGGEITVPEGTEVVLQGRAQHSSGADVVQADVFDVTLHVFDPSSSTPATALHVVPFVITDTIYDTLQTDSSWALDNKGYNVKVPIDVEWLPTGGKRYRYELQVDVQGQSALSPITPLRGIGYVKTRGVYAS